MKFVFIRKGTGISNMQEFITNSIQETFDVAGKLAKSLKPGTLVTFEGNLGSGKTTFIKGLVAGLGLKRPDEVKSPTFALMHIYQAKCPVYHFDLYRLEKPEEAENIGFVEFSSDPAAVTCVEWPEKAGSLIPKSAVRVRLSVEGETRRKVQIIMPPKKEKGSV